METICTQIYVVKQKISKFDGIQFFDQEKVVQGILLWLQKYEPLIDQKMEEVAELIGGINQIFRLKQAQTFEDYVQVCEKFERIQQMPAHSTAVNCTYDDNKELYEQLQFISDTGLQIQESVSAYQDVQYLEFQQKFQEKFPPPEFIQPPPVIDVRENLGIQLQVSTLLLRIFKVDVLQLVSRYDLARYNEVKKICADSEKMIDTLQRKQTRYNLYLAKERNCILREILAVLNDLYSARQKKIQKRGIEFFEQPFVGDVQMSISIEKRMISVMEKLRQDEQVVALIEGKRQLLELLEQLSHICTQNLTYQKSINIYYSELNQIVSQSSPQQQEKQRLADSYSQKVQQIKLLLHEIQENKQETELLLQQGFTILNEAAYVAQMHAFFDTFSVIIMVQEQFVDKQFKSENQLSQLKLEIQQGIAKRINNRKILIKYENLIKFLHCINM